MSDGLARRDGFGLLVTHELYFVILTHSLIYRKESYAGMIHIITKCPIIYD